jgi:hypothetical protein
MVVSIVEGEGVRSVGREEPLQIKTFLNFIGWL